MNTNTLARILASKPYLSDEEFTIQDMMSQCGNKSKGAVSSAMVNGMKLNHFEIRSGKRGKLRVNIYKRKKHNTAWFKKPLVTEPSPEDTYCTWESSTL
jgi:hypothetical protein